MFSKIQKEKANFILNNKYAKFDTLESFQIKDLAVIWCYYSGKIEGNTYTYVETEALLKDGITSTKKYEDAKMLKNLYNTFISLVETIKKQGKIEINDFLVKSIHSMLTEELLSVSKRATLREIPVAITGTSYTPPKEIDEIKTIFSNIFIEQDKYINPLERAVFLHCNIAKLQPFIDGNKRTSRLVESVELMNNNIIPVYSSKEEDLIKYRNAIIHFYESNDYSLYIDYFLDRQIERINNMSTSKDIKFEL